MGPGSDQGKIPVLDSPRTPDTPTSQIEIGPAVQSAPSTPRAAGGGRWGQYNSITPVYSPPSLAVAKRFLRIVGGSAQQLPPRSLPETPLTSQAGHHIRKGMPTCHGCHGPIGQGMHMGSAPGKQPCTLAHSLYCRGGIIEDESWRACPQGYQFDPSIELANGPGLEETLSTQDFHSSAWGGGLVNSTPALHQDIARSTEPPLMQNSQSVPVRQQLVERFPGRVNVGFSSPGPDGARALPPRPAEVQHNQGQSLGAVQFGSLGLSQIPEDVQNEIIRHRAVNQVETDVHHRKGEIDIAEL